MVVPPRCARQKVGCGESPFGCGLFRTGGLKANKWAHAYIYVLIKAPQAVPALHTCKLSQERVHRRRRAGLPHPQAGAERQGEGGLQAALNSFAAK
jgi:hypothetical protein